MRVDLRRLDEATGVLVLEESVPYLDVFDEEREVVCTVNLAYRRSAGACYFHGVIEGRFESPCHRCLEPVSQPVSGQFDAVVKRSGSAHVGTGPDDDAGDDGEFITLGINEHEVSFDSHIRENVVVNIPMQILCGDDCRGLCPTCGANLNDKSCGCGRPSDGRWDSLRDIERKSGD